MKMKFLAAAGVEFIFTIIANVVNIPFYYYSLKVPQNDVIKDLIPQVTRQVTHCKSDFSYYDPDLGYFGPTNVAGCKASQCPPERPSVINTRFLLVTNKFGERFITYDDSTALKLFTSDTVVIIIHGTFQSYYIDPWFNETTSYWLRLGADVILVDWSAGNKDFRVSAANTQTVAAQTGQLMSYFNIMEKTTCVGVGSGAHVCGLAGQWLKFKKQPKLAKCTGLDPAGGPFNDCPGNYTLSPNDCGVVNVVHTSYSPEGEGMDRSLGHCDFWVNYLTPFDDCDGRKSMKSMHQAVKTAKVIKHGSKMKKLSSNRIYKSLSDKFSCRHKKAMYLYLEQLASYPMTKFTTKPCKSKIESCNSLFSNRNSSDASLNIVKRSASYFMAKELIREPLPPFDRCSKEDDQDFCLCVRDTFQPHSSASELTPQFDDEEVTDTQNIKDDEKQPEEDEEKVEKDTVEVRPTKTPEEAETSTHQ